MYIVIVTPPCQQCCKSVQIVLHVSVYGFDVKISEYETIPMLLTKMEKDFKWKNSIVMIRAILGRYK